MIGTVIGNYRIEREIGEGGMSHVYVGRTINATDALPPNFPIVLKVMTEELAGEVTARKRFVIGYRRSRPKLRLLTLTPGGAWRRLYSAVYSICCTRETTSRGATDAASSSTGRSCSTSPFRISSS